MAEAAKLWVAAGGNLPRQVADIIGSDALRSAHFEFPTTVRGGGRSMTDIMAFVPDGVIAVEAKARETFDEPVSEWIVAGARKSPASPPHRRSVIEWYAGEFGVSAGALMDCRYQLLHRTLSAVLTAQEAGATDTWMIVQSFASLDAPEHHRNRADFDRFVERVGDQPRLAGRAVTLSWVQEV